MNKAIETMEKISFVLLCILMVDCSIMGFSAWGQFGPIASRMFIMLLVIIFAIPALLKNFKQIVTNKYFVAVVAFAVVLVMAAIIGFVNGNKTSLIVRDIKGFFSLIIIPVTLLLINSKKRIHCLMKCMMAGTTVIAVYSIISLILFLNDKVYFNQLAIDYRSVQFAFYGYISASIPRLFYQSSVYLFCGCAFALYFFVTEKRKIRWIYPVMMGLCLFALLMTYTRSLYLAAFVAAVTLVIVMLLLVGKKQRKELLKGIATAALVFGVIVTIFSTATNTNYIKFAVLRSASSIDTSEIVDGDSTEDDTEDDTIPDEDDYLKETEKADNIRKVTIEGLLRNIKKSPIIGIGLGAEIEERPGSSLEYLYLDMVAKMGIIGLLVYFVPFAIMFKRLWDIRKKIAVDKAAPLMYTVVLIGSMVFSFFHPYLSGALGILFYCCTLGCVNWLETEIQDEIKSLS